MKHKTLKTSFPTFLLPLLLTLVSSLALAATVTPADEILQHWQSKGREAQSYKRFFEAVKSDKAEAYWKLYQDLSKNKKLLKLQHESIKKIIQLDLESPNDTTGKFKKFASVAKKMLRNLRGQPEGLEYELSYLKWILKNKKTSELCTTERQRWLSQAQLKLDDVFYGLQSCAVTYNDFIYRLRLLIFSGEESQARAEIEKYNKANKLENWQKAYLEAVFFTNIGDPVSAYNQLSGFEKEISQNEDYVLNFFYIAQRAGQQEKAEQIINKIMAAEKKPVRLNELKMQKALLYYQTRRYKEANVIFDELVKLNFSYKRKRKSTEFDDLTWLRAWTSYLMGNYNQAHTYLTENLSWTRDKAKTQYWLAQTELAQGETLQALEHLRVLATPVLQGRFFNYYNSLAWMRFEQNKNLMVSDIMRSQVSTIRSGKGAYLIPDQSTTPQQLLAGYGDYIEMAESTDQGQVTLVNSENSVIESNDTEGIQLPSSAALQAELAWADDLTKWGYRDVAKWHLYEVEKKLKTKSDVVPLAQYYLKNQYYNRAVQLMQKVANPNAKKLNLVDEETLWLSLLPRAYGPKLTSEAQKNKINPYLIWSIMKSETQYKPDAISPVGAVGLMQFMPYTSKKVAPLVQDTFEPGKLFNPETAVQYGATYLKKLSDELGGEMHLVAAAYNGGPHRVKLWLRNLKKPNEPNVNSDVFIEHIPFNETRTYVKRVLNYYLAYQKLYDDKFDMKSAKWLTEPLVYNIKEPISLKEEWPSKN